MYSEDSKKRRTGIKIARNITLQREKKRKREVKESKEKNNITLQMKTH